MKNILFVCIHNSARSQMAEAFVNALGLKDIRAQSAGLESGSLNPVVVAVMAELGIDISQNRTKTVHDPGIASQSFDYVITVCDESSAAACPVFPGAGRRVHWSFPDPSALPGTHDERLVQTRATRDAIRERVYAWHSEEFGRLNIG